MSISISKNNYNRINHRSQPLNDCWPIDVITQDPEFFFKNLTNTKRSLIEQFIRLSYKYKHVYLRQDTLGSLLQISREHCNKLIRWMKDCGLLVVEYRHKLSCHYTLSSFFFNASIQSRLKHIFRSLRALSLGLLTTFSSEFTQRVKKLIKNLINPIVKHPTDESSMQFNQTYHGDKPVSVAIRELKVLNLTRAGQIKLSVFPDEAILEAANAMKYAKNVKEPYNWFYKLCFEYCRRNDIDPDWAFMHQLIEKYKISLTAPMMSSKAPSTGTPTGRFSNSTRDNTSPVPPINATSKEFREKTEWKGHVEVQRVQSDQATRREALLKNLTSNNYFVIAAMKIYPFEVQQETINLLAFDDSCYCQLLKTVCGWSHDCMHNKGEINEAQGLCSVW